ncbi:MAG: acetylxylan esterase [Thiohalocapsa sp.]
MRREFKPSLRRPEDFDLFWNSTRSQLERVDPDMTLSLQDSPISSPIQYQLAEFTSLGRARITGHFLQWQTEEPRPLLIHSHGYGCHCEPRWDWAQRGFNVMGVDIRGFGLSAEALQRPSRFGYVLTGIEAPETSILRLAVCDYMQAARIGSLLCRGRISRTVLHGVSFAGGLALMAESILQIADLLAVGVPTFGWAEGRNFFVKSGSGAEISAYLEKRPEFADDVMLVLSYFDTVSFADRVTCPTLVGLGLHDEVVPAKTVYAIANHLAGPHEIMEFPISHSDHPDEQLWSRFEAAWGQLAAEGIPDDFGAIRTRHPWEA